MASSRGSAVSPVASRADRASVLPRARCVWMFSIVTVASSTRMPTESARPPRVMILTVCPVSQRANVAAKSAIGYSDDDHGAAHIPEEEEHHQAGQYRADRALRHQVGDRAGNVRRLVELIADRHAVRQHALEFGEVRLDQADDGERGGIARLVTGTYTVRRPFTSA